MFYKAVKELLNLETWDRKTKVIWLKSSQPLKITFGTYTLMQVNFLFYSNTNHANSGKIWNQNNFIGLSCNQQFGVRYPLAHLLPGHGEPSAKHSQAGQQEKNTPAA